MDINKYHTDANRTNVSMGFSMRFAGMDTNVTDVRMKTSVITKIKI